MPARYTARNPLPREQRGHAVGEQRERQGERGVEPAGRKRAPPEQLAPAVARPRADAAPTASWITISHRELRRRQLAGPHQVGGERDREDDRDRIVDARLDLERDAHPALELEPAAPQHREHRRRVGGRHHRAQHQRLRPAQPEQLRAAPATSERGEHDPGGRERRGRRPAPPELAPAAC